MTSMIKIAVDAMGGDNSPKKVIDGIIHNHRSNKNNFKIYQVNSQKVYHDIGTSVETKNEEELSKLKSLYSWHFIWSKFYYYRKRYGKFLALILFLPALSRIIFRICLNTISGNKVTKLKESKDEIIDHERITHILKSVQLKAKRNKIDPEIIVRIWQIFIQEAIKLESSKIKK